MRLEGQHLLMLRHIMHGSPGLLSAYGWYWRGLMVTGTKQHCKYSFTLSKIQRIDCEPGGMVTFYASPTAHEAQLAPDKGQLHGPRQAWAVPGTAPVSVPVPVAAVDRLMPLRREPGGASLQWPGVMVEPGL